MTPMPTVALRDLDVYYEHDGSGPRLLLLNGSGSSIETSGALLTPFRTAFEVLVLDQRGLGRTTVPDATPTMADYAADVVSLARTHGALIGFAHMPQRDPLNETATYPGVRLARFCAEHRVPFIDLLVAMRAVQRERVVYWPRDGHPNAEGTHVIAGELFASLHQIVP